MSQHNGEALKELNEESERKSNAAGSLSPTQKTKSTRQKIFKNVLSLGLLVFIDIILPIILFTIFKHFVPEIWAVVISGVPPFLLVITNFIINRRIDILGMLILVSFIVSAIVSQFRGDPKLFLLQKSAVTASIGVLFLISLIPFKIGSFKMRPLTFYFAKDAASGGFFGHSGPGTKLSGLTEDEPMDDRWERFWNSYSMFRRGLIVITAGWGVGLLCEIPIRVLIIYKVDAIEQDILYTNIVTYTLSSVLILATVLYSASLKKKMRKGLAGDGQMEDGQK
nr:1378_t:CDS:1 [Entrophospora candida]CAG8603860.1 10897_t:CDS:1 [Entrophospora candida]